MDADEAHELADKALFKELKNIIQYLRSATEKADRLIKNASESGEYQITIYLDQLCESVKVQSTKNELWWKIYYYLINNNYSVQRFSKERDDGELFRSFLIKW